MGEVESTDKIIYEGHLTLVQRPHEGRMYDIVVSRDAAIMLYIDDQDQVYLTKQFRPAIGKEVIALPAETLDKPHLSPLETMIEGLQEECGIEIDKNQVIERGRSISTDGHDTERVYLFLAHGRGEYVGQRLEDHEKIEIVKMSFDEAYQMVIDCKIEGSKTKELILYEKLRRLGATK